MNTSSTIHILPHPSLPHLPAHNTKSYHTSIIINPSTTSTHCNRLFSSSSHHRPVFHGVAGVGNSGVVAILDFVPEEHTVPEEGIVDTVEVVAKRSLVVAEAVHCWMRIYWYPLLFRWEFVSMLVCWWNEGRVMGDRVGKGAGWEKGKGIYWHDVRSSSDIDSFLDATHYELFLWMYGFR